MADENPYAPPRAKPSAPTAERTQPPLWNPLAAAGWSLLFGPAFGAVLNALNWDALGEPERADSSRTWAMGLLAAFAAIALARILWPESTVFAAALQPFHLVSLLVWYASSGRAQQRYVAERFGSAYPRRGWIRPAVVAILVAGILGMVLGLLAWFIESVKGGRP